MDSMWTQCAWMTGAPQKWGYLISSPWGTRRIAIVTGPLSLKNERARLRGYRQALTKAGLPPSGITHLDRWLQP